MAQFKIPFGNAKGKTLGEADTKDIEWVGSKIREKLEADPNKKFAEKDRDFLIAARAELERRKAGGQQQQAPRQQSAALATRNSDTLIAGANHDASAVNMALAKASREYHLVAPATSCDALPPGCGVALSLVYVDPSTAKDGPGEVYDISGGKVGLSGTTLKRIGAAAGIDWDPVRSGRLDDGRDPHYCHYRAVGIVQNFDGSRRTVSGEVEMDLREGSPAVQAMHERTEAANRKYRQNKSADGQIRDMRLFILRHAETKAKLRAIADMGIKRSYTTEELSKPFAVARVMWTGQTNDPALKLEAFRMQHAAMTGATQAMYGAPERHSLPQFSGHSAPPVGSIDDDPDDIGSYDYETTSDDAPSQPRNAPVPQQPAAASPAQPPAGAGDSWEGDGDAQGRML